MRDSCLVPVLTSGLCRLLLGCWLCRAGAENRKETREETRLQLFSPVCAVVAQPKILKRKLAPGELAILWRC